MNKNRYVLLIFITLFLLSLGIYSYAEENDNLSLFVDAVYNGDIERMKELSTSVNINSELPEAIRKTYEKTFPFLKLNKPITPFSIAVIKRDEKVILELLKLGVDVKKSSNMLAVAIIGEINETILELFLKKRIDVNVMFSMGEGNMLPVSAAIIMDNYELVKILLTYGADANLPDNLSITPMHYAAIKDKKYIDLLIEYGGDINAGSHYSKPISLAASKGNINSVKYLISKGAEVDFEGEGNIFLKALINKDKELAKLAVLHGAVNSGWDELLKHAILTEDIFFVELLLQNGYKLNDEHVFFAISYSNVDIVKLLFEKYNAEFSDDYLLALVTSLYCYEGDGVEIYEYLNRKKLLSLESTYKGYTFEAIINSVTGYKCNKNISPLQTVIIKTIPTKDDKLKLINRLKGNVYDSK
jgi:ankyrin repeat protein